MNKRMLTRVSYVTNAIVGSSTQQAAEAETVNISLNGVLLRTAQSLDLRQGNAVHIALPTAAGGAGEPVEIDCTVIRNEACLLALQYEAMEYDTLGRLRGIVLDVCDDPARMAEEFLRFLAGESVRQNEIENGDVP